MLELHYTYADSVNYQLKKLIAPRICGDFEVLRTENGKPYIKGNPVYFSLSHSKNRAVIAICDRPVGVDMELLDRSGFYGVLSRFSLREQAFIGKSAQRFLENWTAKEAFVKMKGEKIFPLFKRLEYFDNKLFLDATPQSCGIYGRVTDGAVVTVCVKE